MAVILLGACTVLEVKLSTPSKSVKWKVLQSSKEWQLQLRYTTCIGVTHAVYALHNLCTGYKYTLTKIHSCSMVAGCVCVQHVCRKAEIGHVCLKCSTGHTWIVSLTCNMLEFGQVTCSMQQHLCKGRLYPCPVGYMTRYILRERSALEWRRGSAEGQAWGTSEA